MTSRETSHETSHETPQQLLRRYRWQCRRGASEVEGVLNAYLDRCFLNDDAEEQALFGRLLECPDVDMLEWFIGRSEPADGQLRGFVARMLERVAATD